MSDETNLKKIDFSKIKSSAGVNAEFIEIVEKNIVSSKEEYVAYPTSVLELLFSGVGDISGDSFYQQRALKNEMNPSTAKLLESLMCKMTSDEVSNIYAKPASAVFFIGFPKDQIISQSILDTENTGLKKIRINKELKFTFTNYNPFVLDHSIDFHISNYNSDDPIIKASYDLSDKYDDTISQVKNNILSIRELVYQGVLYVGVVVTAREMVRTTHEYIVNSVDELDYTFNFENKLMGFELLYKTDTTNSSANWAKLEGLPNGQKTLTGYNYSLTMNSTTKQIKVSFSRLVNGFNPALRSGLKMIIYTTNGSDSNFSIPNIDSHLNNITFDLQQDSNNQYEVAMNSILGVISLMSTNIVGGVDNMSFEEIRDYIIGKSNNNKILSNNDVVNTVKNILPDAVVSKIKHDISLTYDIKGILRDINDASVIASGTSDIYFENDEKLGIGEVYEVNARTLKPSHVYEYDEKNDRYNLVLPSNKLTYSEYKTLFQDGGKKESFFPFYVKNVYSNYISSKIYDISVDDILTVYTGFYDAISLDIVNIMNISISKNPLINEVVFDKSYEYYAIKFYAIVGDSLLAQIKQMQQDYLSGIVDYPILNFRLVMTGLNNGKIMYTDCVISEIDDDLKRLTLEARLYTNNSVNDNDEIMIENSSIAPVPIIPNPINFYFLDSSVKMEIMVAFKSKEFFNQRNEIYDRYMDEQELEEGYFVGYVFTIDKVDLFSNITNNFSIVSNVKLKEDEYETYEEDVYETYGDVVYALDEDGNIQKEMVDMTLADNTVIQIEQAVILHGANDIKLYKDPESGEMKPKVIHKTGDFVYDDLGYPIKKDVVTATYSLLKNVPWVDRIYALASKYFDIKKSYYEILSKVDSVNVLMLDGMSVSTSFKKTTGVSNSYSVVMTSGDSRVVERLNDIAISLSFEVTFKEDYSSSKDYNIEMIKNMISSYINTFTGDELMFSNLITHLENNIPSISSITFLNVNQYQNVRSIVKDTSVTDEEILNIRNTIGDDGTLIPSIEVSVIS